jgi:pteridine reductase
MSRLVSIFGTHEPVVLVTGSGAMRVGNAIIRAFAEQGYLCLVHAHRSVEAAKQTVAQLRSLGTEAEVVIANLCEEMEVRAMIDQAYERFGRLDVLVNSAAMWESLPLEEVTAADVQRHFTLNTLATFVACQQAGLKMAQQAYGGAIINLGDWAVARPYLHYAAYFPSKGAIPALTRDFAVELAQRNPRMRVNAILPGPVMLPLDLSPEERTAAIRGTLLKREGSPHHVAQAAIFLAENDFITGVCLPIDGGRTICSE